MGASPVFELNHEKLAADPRFAEIGAALDEFSPIDSDETFNLYCRQAREVWTGHFRKPVGEISHRFTDLLERVERRSQSVIKTDWGGVVITLHEPPRVEKFLVIRKGGYLALEMHEDVPDLATVVVGVGGGGLVSGIVTALAGRARIVAV